MQLTIRLYISILLFISTVCAEDIYLYDRYGLQIKNYKSVVADMKSGDIIHFDNKKSFELVNRLGGGGTTQVYSVKWTDSSGNLKTSAIRLAKSTGIAGKSSTVYNTFLNVFSDTHSILEELNVPIPEIYESVKSRYILVEKLDIVNGETLQTFLENFQNSSLSAFEFKDRIDAFKNLVTKTSHVSEISDFKLEQVLYDSRNKRWVIADWTYPFVTSSLVKSEFLFNDKLLEEAIGGESTDVVKHFLEEVSLINKKYALDNFPEFLSERNKLFKLIQKNDPKNIVPIINKLNIKPFSEINDPIISNFYKDNIEDLLKMDVINTRQKINLLQPGIQLIESERIRNLLLDTTHSSGEYIELIRASIWSSYPTSFEFFFKLQPSENDVMLLADLLTDKTAQLSFLNDYIDRIDSVESFLRVVNYPEIGINIHDDYHAWMILSENMEKFLSLGPNSSEVKYFESILQRHQLIEDFQLLLDKQNYSCNDSLVSFISKLND